jgi:hypothetical protein
MKKYWGIGLVLAAVMAVASSLPHHCSSRLSNRTLQGQWIVRGDDDQLSMYHLNKAG